MQGRKYAIAYKTFRKISMVFYIRELFGQEDWKSNMRLVFEFHDVSKFAVFVRFGTFMPGKKRMTRVFPGWGYIDRYSLCWATLLRLVARYHWIIGWFCLGPRARICEARSSISPMCRRLSHRRRCTIADGLSPWLRISSLLGSGMKRLSEDIEDRS